MREKNKKNKKVPLHDDDEVRARRFRPLARRVRTPPIIIVSDTKGLKIISTRTSPGPPSRLGRKTGNESRAYLFVGYPQQKGTTRAPVPGRRTWPKPKGRLGQMFYTIISIIIIIVIIVIIIHVRRARGPSIDRFSKWVRRFYISFLGLF